MNERVITMVGSLTLAQLVIGTLLVVLIHAQSAPLTDQVIRSQQQLVAVEQRLASLEAVRADARLSVLEGIMIRVEKIEFLIYGLIITMAGNLFMTILQIRLRRSRE